jgi:ABC-2 type transport system ATP-binding protein
VPLTHPPAPAVECRSVTRRFGDVAVVSDLSFSVPAGSVLALLGHNGAGKTTTIRLLNGVLAPDVGTMSVLGLDPATQGNALRARTAVLTENAGIDDRLSPRENLEMTAALRSLSGPPVAAHIDSLLERFDLGRDADRLCNGFSTGQRRRVALARCLLADPEVLFLDEPTSGLDPDGAVAVLDLISELARERGRTVVLCTHFLDEADGVADYMAVMARGRLLGFGRPEQLAAQRWPELAVEVEVAPAAADRAAELLADLSGIRIESRQGATLNLAVRDRDLIPVAVSTLVSAGVAVYGSTARPRSLRDVYHDLHDSAPDDVTLADADAHSNADVAPSEQVAS